MNSAGPLGLRSRTSRDPHSQKPNVDGILNLNKPQGWTSHDVVAHVRRLTRIRRVGHAGTLDPMATGVLLVCLGRATRIAEYLMAGRKRYRAVVRLGISTDSHDADGQITASAPVSIDLEDVEGALSDFRGSIAQVPPMVSAIKRDGQPLYKLARRGMTVQRAARPVEVYELTLTDWQPPSLTLELACSPGTYVRALARDLGLKLGCGAHLTELIRLASGSFSLSRAIELEQFNAAVASADGAKQDSASDGQVPGWHHLVMPMDAGLKHLPACTLGTLTSRRIRSGQPLTEDQIVAPKDKVCRAYAACDSDKKLVALLKFDDSAGLWRPHKVFHPL
jgi:tRNA pseudouridine55 synthase